MPKKTIALITTLSLFVFLLFGDFLPQPLRSASQQTRNGMNEAVYSLFPSWRPKTNPYERTEKAIEEDNQRSK